MRRAFALADSRNAHSARCVFVGGIMGNLLIDGRNINIMMTNGKRRQAYGFSFATVRGMLGFFFAIRRDPRERYETIA